MKINEWADNAPAKTAKGRRRTERFAAPQTSLLPDDTPLDGDALGDVWEAWVDAALEAHAIRHPLLVCRTQPYYVGPPGKAKPAGKGWLDRIVCHAHGTTHVELKAVVQRGDHQHRWALPLSLRADKREGHQARRLAALAKLGHRAFVLLGVQEPERLGLWSAVYLIPATSGGLPSWASPASATWEELAPYRLEPASPKRVVEMLVGGAP